MNRFIIDHHPVAIAKQLCDEHIVKMVLEEAQMLNTAVRIHAPEFAEEAGLYKIAYTNHPCTIWAREASGNYEWLYQHFLALSFEYTYRYGKQHASYVKLHKALAKCPDNITQSKMTKLAQAMPDEYKHPDPIVAYRTYVVNEKHYAKWEKGREQPKWWSHDRV